MFLTFYEYGNGGGKYKWNNMLKRLKLLPVRIQLTKKYTRFRNESIRNHFSISIIFSQREFIVLNVTLNGYSLVVELELIIGLHRLLIEPIYLSD